jgi:hypothetical protein
MNGEERKRNVMNFSFFFPILRRIFTKSIYSENGNGRERERI